MQTFALTNERYEGNFVNGRLEGIGKYFFANGNIYEGEFKNGQFHGNGCIHFANKGTYKAIFKFGQVVEGKYIFADKLEYKDNWQYCTQPDRRLQKEIVEQKLLQK